MEQIGADVRLTSPDDAQIVALLRSRSEAGVEALLTRYHARLLAYAYRLLGDRQAAEDAIQEALIKFLDHLDDLRDPTKLRSYLYRIATRSCRDQQRRPARRELAVEATPERWEDPVAIGTDRCYVAKLLKELAPIHAEVLVLRFYEDMELDAIAAALGLPVGTVKSRLHYALKQLRKSIAARDTGMRAGVLTHE